MEQIRVSFTFVRHAGEGSLDAGDRALLEAARAATATAHAPYSGFRVGAALRLAGGVELSGANQENAAFPAGLCAERVVLSAAAATHPGETIAAMAISYDSGAEARERPISPCGICRQTLLEYEDRQGHPIRMILGGMQGEVWVLARAADLLPLRFSAKDLEKT